MGVVWTFYSPLSFLSSFSLSLGDGPIKTEILSQKAAEPKIMNQSTKEYSNDDLGLTVSFFMARSHLLSRLLYRESSWPL